MLTRTVTAPANSPAASSEEAERRALQDWATQKLSKFKSRASGLSRSEIAARAAADTGEPTGSIDPTGQYETP